MSEHSSLFQFFSLFVMFSPHSGEFSLESALKSGKFADAWSRPKGTCGMMHDVCMIRVVNQGIDRQRST